MVMKTAYTKYFKHLCCGNNIIFFSESLDEGFTLVEVITTIVMAGILGTVMMQFMGTNISRSSRSVVSVQNGYQLREAMEEINRDYRGWLENSPDSALSDFKTRYIDTFTNPDISLEATYIDVDSGKDGDIDILKVVISDSPQTMMMLFTK
jgi:prepilin-type N-terminal cleavage/methylation domain-containing protein